TGIFCGLRMTVTSVKISLASMGVCAGLGAFGEAELEADVISLGASPSTISYSPGDQGPGDQGSPTLVSLTPLGGTFGQYNDSVVHGKGFANQGGFAWANVAQGQRIDKNIVFTGSLIIAPTSFGERLFAFKQGSHYGWIKENLGGSGVDITFISGAYNDGTDLNNDFIIAGTLSGGGGGGGVALPEPGTTGLMGLAALAAGATAIRRRRAATATVSVDSAS
ncbi:MAG: PEP-CTERM sorting domain-containing protein, partial [Planctomyces sp.]